MDLNKLINLIKDKERISFYEMQPEDKNHFYFFQYPEHLIDGIGYKKWCLLTKLYPQYFGMPTIIAERWKYLQPEHIENANILDLGCNIGVEVYNILKHLNPKKITAIDNNQTALDVFKLCVEDNFNNLEISNFDVLESYNKKLNGTYDVITLMGRLLSYNYRHETKLKEWNENVEKICKFIELQNPKYFYVLGFGKEFINKLQEFFNKPLIHLDTKNTRSEMFLDENKQPKLRIQPRKQLEYYGYMEI